MYRLYCFFKQKTAYEMRSSDWSSDECSSDLTEGVVVLPVEGVDRETGRLIADLAAASLQKQEIAASVEASNRSSLFLHGAGRRLPDGALEISWTLARPDGTLIGERVDALSSATEHPAPPAHLEAAPPPRQQVP